MKWKISLRTKQAKSNSILWQASDAFQLKNITIRKPTQTPTERSLYVYSVFFVFELRPISITVPRTYFGVNHVFKFFFVIFFLSRKIWASLCFESKSFLLRRLNFSHVLKTGVYMRLRYVILPMWTIRSVIRHIWTIKVVTSYVIWWSLYHTP